MLHSFLSLTSLSGVKNFLEHSSFRKARPYLTFAVRDRVKGIWPFIELQINYAEKTGLGSYLAAKSSISISENKIGRNAIFLYPVQTCVLFQFSVWNEKPNINTVEV